MMIRSVLAAMAAVAILSTTVHAGHVGSLTRDKSGAEWQASLGYTRMPANWDAADASFEVLQNQIYLEGGREFGRLSVMGRLGLSDWQVSSAFADGKRFEGIFLPYVAAGAQGAIYKTRYFELGPYAMLTLLPFYEDQRAGMTKTIGVTSYTGTESYTFRYLFELETGLKWEMVLEGARLYFGPSFYYAQGEADYRIGAYHATPTINLAKTVGGFAGIRWKLDEALSLELETKLRDGLVAGGALIYEF